MSDPIPTSILALAWADDVATLANGVCRWHKHAVAVPIFTMGVAVLETSADGGATWAAIFEWAPTAEDTPSRVFYLDAAHRYLRVRRTGDATGWVERYDQRDRNIPGGGA